MNLHGAGHLAAGAHDDAPGVHLQGGQLAVPPVAHNDNVPRADGLLNLLGAARADDDPPLHRLARHIPHQNGAVQNVDQVLVAGSGDLQAVGVDAVHVGGGHVLHRDDPLQVLLPVHHAQGVQLLVPHGHPGPAQAHLSVYPLRRADIHVPDMGAYVSIELGLGDLEVVQHKFRLPVQQPRPAGLAGVLRVQDILQPAVGNGGTDGIRVRIAVPDHLDRAGGACLNIHSFPHFFRGLRSSQRAFQQEPADFHPPARLFYVGGYGVLALNIPCFSAGVQFFC